jgi:hypothetical protein
MPEQQVYRSFNQRQHRILALYLTLRAWQSGADVVVVSRSALEAFLQISRFETARKKWIKDDMAPWFPHGRVLIESGTSGKLLCIYLSRTDLKSVFPSGTMSDEQRLKGLAANGVRGIKVSKLPSEKEMATLLSGLAGGLVDLTEMTKA